MAGLFDQLRGELFGREGRAWAGSVEDLLFDGESIDRTVSLGDNRIVVTSHRLLAFTPTTGDENYRQVDIPNVSDVRAGHDGEDTLVARAVQVILSGAILLAVGVLFDFDSIVPTDAFAGAGEGAGQLGIGGLMGMMQQLLALIAMIDDIARAFGALLVLLGVVIVAVYLLTRDRVIVVSVAGDATDITVPPGEDASENAVEDAVGELETVLFESEGVPPEEPTRSGDAGFKTDDPL
jgi:hypothetical protein